MNRVSKNRELIAGFVILSLYFLWALAWLINIYFFQGSVDAPYLPSSDISKELLPALTSGYLLGTDLFGRSLFEVISQGLLYTITISMLISFMSLSIGILLGYLVAVSNRFVSSLFDLFINIMFIFPSILVAILVMSLSGQSIWGLVFALTITGWPSYARIAKGEITRVFNLEYVEASKALGIGRIRLLFRIILPAIMPILIVNLILGISGVIVSEAVLGFLGLGGSVFSWGVLLSYAKTVLLESPKMTIVLSLVLGGLIMGLNLLGDGLRDYYDPKN